MAVTSRRSSRAKSASVSTLTGIDWDAVRAADMQSIAFDTVPPGWFTSDQFAEQIVRSRDAATRRLTAMVKAGRAETKAFRIPCATRTVYPVLHYRIIK